MGEPSRDVMAELMSAHAKILEKRGDDWRKYDPAQGDNIQADFHTAAKYLRQAAFLLRELEAGGWRPITEAPKDEPFLAWGAPYRYLCRWSDKWNEWVSDHDGDPPAPAYAPTLFQMLPAPPTTSDGTE